VKIGDGHEIMRFAEISRRAMIESVLNAGGRRSVCRLGMPDAVDPAETIHHKTHKGHKGFTVTELTRLLLGGFVRCVRLRGDGPPRTIRIREKINCNDWVQLANGPDIGDE